MSYKSRATRLPRWIRAYICWYDIHRRGPISWWNVTACNLVMLSWLPDKHSLCYCLFHSSWLIHCPKSQAGKKTIKKQTRIRCYLLNLSGREFCSLVARQNRTPLEILGFCTCCPQLPTCGRGGHEHVCCGLMTVSLLCVDRWALALLIPATVQHVSPKDTSVGVRTRIDPHLTQVSVTRTCSAFVRSFTPNSVRQLLSMLWIMSQDL